jgi:hypothetical protein
MNWWENLGHKRIPSLGLLLSHFLVFLTLTTIAVAQPLLQLYGDNLPIFSAAKMEGFDVLLFAVLVILVPPLLLLMAEIAVSVFFPQHNRIAHQVLVWLALWLVVLLLLRSVSFGSWQLAMVSTALIAAIMQWAFFRWSLLVSWLRMMSSISLAVLALFAISASGVIWVPTIGAANITVTDDKGVAGGTSNKDISVALLVLDELPLFALLGSDGKINETRFPGFAELARSSTWYRNVLTTSQTTTAAVPAILSGRFPKSNDEPPLLANHPKNLFTLLGESVAMDVREIVTTMCPRVLCGKALVAQDVADNNQLSESEPDVQSGLSRSFVNDAFVVLGHKLLPTQLREKLPPTDEGWGGFVQTAKPDESSPLPSASTTVVQLEDVKTRAEEAENWHTNGPPSQVENTRLFINRVSRTSVPSLHFLHTLLPHRPWTLASDMRTFSNLGLNRQIPNDRLSSLNELRVFLQQLIATDSLILELVTKLKKSPNWNRTMLIVTADHGMSLEAGTWKRKFVEKSKTGTLEDLFRVPLFIKYPDQASGDINDCTSSSVDILPTIAAVKSVSAGWSYDGDDLRSRCINRPSRKVIWNEGQSTLTSGVEALRQRADFYSKLVPYEGGIDGASSVAPYGALINRSVPASTQREAGVSSWTLNQAQQMTNVASGEWANIPLEVSGTVVLTRGMPSDAMGLLLVNGKVSGMFAEIAGQAPGATVAFRSMLTASSLVPGNNTVELAIVEGGADAAVITFVGRPT